MAFACHERASPGPLCPRGPTRSSAALTAACATASELRSVRAPASAGPAGSELWRRGCRRRRWQCVLLSLRASLGSPSLRKLRSGAASAAGVGCAGPQGPSGSLEEWHGRTLPLHHYGPARLLWNIRIENLPVPLDSWHPASIKASSSVVQRLSHLPDPRSGRGSGGDPGSTCPDNGRARPPPRRLAAQDGGEECSLHAHLSTEPRTRLVTVLGRVT